MRVATILLLTTVAVSAQTPFLGPQLGLHQGNAEKDLLRISSYLTIGANYGAGLGRAVVGPDGKVPDDSSYGMGAAAGLSGAHAWRRSMLGISTGTSYFRDFKTGIQGGLGASLTLAYTTELTRRATLSTVLSGGTSMRAFALVNSGFSNFGVYGLEFNDPNLFYQPNNEMVDGRLYSTAASVDLNYNLGAKWAMSAGGSAFTVIRNSTSLLSYFGSSARGQLSRQLGRRSSLGIGYSYSRYDYTKQFGNMNAHSANVSYSTQLWRRVSFTVSGGAARSEVLTLTRVTLDPAIQAILGVSGGTEVLYRVSYSGVGNLSLSRNFRKHSTALNYNMGLSPGNGIYAASKAQSAGFSYGYSGLRKWSVGANAGYGRFDSLMIKVDPYQSFSAGAGAGRALGQYLGFSASVGYRHVISGNNSYTRDYGYASVSFGWNPGAYSLPGWW